VKNDRTEKYVRFPPQTFWRESHINLKIKMPARFTDAGSVDNFISEQENNATSRCKKKPEQDVKLLHLFLVTKNEERKMEDIPTAELNEYVSEFIISVRTKDWKEYEPNSKNFVKL
jgi:hypothetical protein